MPRKDKYKETSSARIEASRGRIYKAYDPVEIAKIFFPQKDSFQKRASFVAIIFELRKAPNQKLPTLNHIPDDYGIRQSSFSKARSKMTRIGLIKRTSGYWGFSSRFESSMKTLINNLARIQAVPNTHDKGMEDSFMESAKTEPVFRQLRKKRKKSQEAYYGSEESEIFL
jgi:hypothetical protein